MIKQTRSSPQVLILYKRSKLDSRKVWERVSQLTQATPLPQQTKKCMYWDNVFTTSVMSDQCVDVVFSYQWGKEAVLLWMHGWTYIASYSLLTKSIGTTQLFLTRPRQILPIGNPPVTTAGLLHPINVVNCKNTEGQLFTILHYSFMWCIVNKSY